MKTEAPMEDGPKEKPISTEPADQKKNPRSTRAKRLCWGRWLLGFLLLVATVLWIAREPITAHFEKELIQRLKERGVYLRYAKRSWLPWRGLRLEKVELDRDAEGHQPVIELSELAVDLPWFEIVRHQSLITRWRSRDATIVLHDSTGAVTFTHVHNKVLLHAGQVEIVRWDFQNGPLVWALTGKILLGPDTDQTPPTPPPFGLDLTVIRQVLGALDVKPGTGPLGLYGNFSVDLSKPDPTWNARLFGAGKTLEWSGVPLREVALDAQLSAQGMQVQGTLQLTKGSSKVALSRANWDTSPLVIEGNLADASGHTDQFKASEDLTTQLVSVSSLSGQANLLEFAHNFPALVPGLPTGATVRTWPDLVVQNWIWSAAGNAPWKIGSIDLKSPANLTFTFGTQVVAIDGLIGHAVYQKNAWQIQAKTGRISGKEWAIREMQTSGEMEPGKARITSKFGLTKGAADLTVTSDNLEHGPWLFTGNLTDGAGLADQFNGRSDGHTTIVNKLEGPANLLEFASNFPMLHARLPEGTQIRKFPNLAVKDFTWREGTAWTLGSLQMRSAASLTVPVKGHPLAIDELTGGAGYDGKAWKLSHLTGSALGGHFTADGLYGNGTLRDGTLEISQLRLKQLSPWFSEQAALEEAILSLDYRGTLGDEPSELSGAGTMRVENAPLVKVPLLDQTYAIFSAFNFQAERHGPGSLNATFTAQKGVLDVSQFAANGDAVKVTASGKVDLVRRQVAARARGNLRGAAGVVTSVISRSLEMEVSGPLDDMRVRPLGPVGVAGAGITEAAETTGKILKEGVTLPFKPLGWFKKDPAKPTP